MLTRHVGRRSKPTADVAQAVWVMVAGGDGTVMGRDRSIWEARRIDQWNLQTKRTWHSP